MDEQAYMGSYMACNDNVSGSTGFCINPMSKRWV